MFFKLKKSILLFSLFAISLFPVFGLVFSQTHDVNIIKKIKVIKGKLGWGSIFIGMTTKEVESQISSTLLIRQGEYPTCGDFGANFGLEGITVGIQLSDESPDGTVQSIFIPFQTLQEKEVLISDLQNHIPDLRYKPSRHAPGLGENENPNPNYILAQNEELAILVKPRLGLFLNLVKCSE